MLLGSNNRKGPEIDGKIGCRTGSAGLIRDLVVGTAGAAHRATLLRRHQGVVHDLAERAGAPAALGAATETAIDLPRRTRRARAARGAHGFIADNVAGTNDHGRPAEAHSLLT